jgi:ParB-like chromosome segregation protein Spo0J
MTSRIEIRYAAPATLLPNPWNSNVVGPEMEARLEESIRRMGFYKPIVVRELPDGSLQILGGEHRTRAAQRMGIAEVPYVNLGHIPDSQAKAIGLADNGRYGEDDALKLGEILKDLGGEDVTKFLPYTEQDLAGIFAADSIDLDMLGLDDEEKGEETIPTLEKPERPTITHALMRFKVPVEDQARVEAFISHVVKTNGFKAEEDSMVAAGMALVAIVSAAREVM